MGSSEYLAVKTLAGLLLRPYGSHRTMLTYESRTITTDPTAHR